MVKIYTLSALLFLLFINIGNAQTAQSFHLQGKFIPSGEPRYIYLTYPNNDEKWIRDSSVVDQGSFSFKGVISYPTVAKLSYAQTWIDIILEPASMDISIKDVKDLSTMAMTGSKSQNELSELKGMIRKVELRWKRVIDTLTAVNKRSNATFQEYRDWVLDPYFKEMKEINQQFINKHPLSFASAHVLYVFARELSTDTLQFVYDRFPPLVNKVDMERQLLNN